MGSAANREGDDVIAFLQDTLPKWIPSLDTSKIQIECAHRIYSLKIDSQTTMIFKVLRYRRRNAILQGRRHPYRLQGGLFRSTWTTAHSRTREGKLMQILLTSGVHRA